jgi:tagatose 1,6-diphosphate aldolase
MKEFSKDIYKVDILKVEFPVNIKFVEGAAAFCGERAYSAEEAVRWFAQADAASRRPYIYLSAGVSIQEFVASLELAATAGVRYSGVLCGRANWQDGVPIYANQGKAAFYAWLKTGGVQNIKAVNECLRSATPWEKWLDAGSGESWPL